MSSKIFPHQFTREELSTFAKADAMFGMSFPYMKSQNAKPTAKPGAIRKFIAAASKFLF